MKNNFDKIDETLDIKATITAKEIIKESKNYYCYKGKIICFIQKSSLSK
jgi:hypothetical protein